MLNGAHKALFCIWVGGENNMSRKEITQEQAGDVRSWMRSHGGEVVDNLGKSSGNKGELWWVRGELIAMHNLLISWRYSYGGHPIYEYSSPILYCSPRYAKLLEKAGVMQFTKPPKKV